MTGNQALARLPMLQRQRDLKAGLNTAGFISGYRGSPLGGLDKTLWQAQQFLSENHIHFQPGVNEDLAATSVWGSQQVNLFQGAKYDGVFGMWYGKGPGVDRSGDVFKHANHAGTSKHGGVLLVAGDDHGCKSSTLPHQTEYAFMDAMIPVLNPAGVQEVIDLGLMGWAMSRYSGCWVALKTIAETVDASFSTLIDLDNFNIQIPKPQLDLHARWPDKPLEQELRLHNEKLDAALAFARLNKINRITLDSPTPRIGIVSTGKSYLDVLQALSDLGIDESLASEIGLRIYKVGMPWPLEPQGIRAFASGLDEVIVVEEKRGLIEDQLTSELYNWHSDARPVVIGKKDTDGNWLLPSTGELTPAVIARALCTRITRIFTSEKIEQRLQFLNEKEQYLYRPKDLVERTPHYCSGCPHNTSTVVPLGSRALGGIGCHYMATWMDRETDTFTQMGGEGATWIGQAPFTNNQHVFQNLGDGTYFHSGLLAIRAAVAAKINITYKILYNDAVAMTGGQPVDGQLSVMQIANQVAGEGVMRIAIASDDIEKHSQADFPAGTTFTHRDDLDALQCELREFQGASVLIYDQTCAAEKRRRRKRGLMPDPQVRPFINSAVCEGCGDCGVKSNCLSVMPLETTYGRKRKIEQTSCNKDLSCVKGFCPSFVSVSGGKVRVNKPDQTLNFDHIPEPTLPSVDQPYGVVLAGVGGTGVTTMGAILGMAAHLEGKGASVLDMTGLAQKFGAVITHLQFAEDANDILASRIAAGGANLVIGCDLVVAAANDSMVKVNRGQAAAIINSHEAMTAEFTREPDAKFPAKSMRGIVTECVGETNTSFVNATEIAEKYIGDNLAANIFLAGYAYQMSLLPISAKAIREAIELNGAGVEQNLKAFNLGRLKAFDSGSLPTSNVQTSETASKPETLDELVEDRSAYLIKYQNRHLADRYIDRVNSFRDRFGDELALLVARYYFKVLAYKDEYEVARLYSDPAFKKALDAEFEGDYRLTIHLAPPLLAPTDPHSKLPGKRSFGRWIFPVFKLLAPFKFLRGTAFDPLGYSADRKLERQIVIEYEAILDQVFAKEQPNLNTAAALLATPEHVRGFGYVKQRHYETARQTQRRLLAKLGAVPEPIKVFDPKAA